MLEANEFRTRKDAERYGNEKKKNGECSYYVIEEWYGFPSNEISHWYSVYLRN